MFEIHLSIVASKCELSYGFDGAAGFLYESAKDRLKWNNLSVKRWIWLVMKIGVYVSMKDQDFNTIGDSGSRAKGVSEMSAEEIDKFVEGKHG